MTAENWELLQVKAQELGISRAKLVTRLARSELSIDTLTFLMSILFVKCQRLKTLDF
jgi:hypothetical protein